ncbi:MAG: hypothetical protein E7359_00540 [Clostridiales bacterium]|nr:hypothetical protein [Clostridiales bacterium]
MKLREVIKLSSIMLNIDEVLNGDKIYDESYDLIDEKSINTSNSVEERNLNLLVKCFNLVYTELATDYFPLITMETIKIENGSFNLNNLSNIFYKIVKIECNDNLVDKFDIYDNILYLKNGEYKIVYAYTPVKVSLNSELNTFNGKISDRVFAYGLNKEYCFISGLYSEAESYRTKFEECLKSASVLKHSIKLPKRRWN